MKRMPIGERRRALVEASLRVIARENFSAATTRAICAEAGMPLASFHYAFESYNDFIAELLAEVLRIDAFQLSAQVPAHDDLLESVRAGFRLFLDRLTSEPGHASLMLELWLLINRTPELTYLTSLVNGRFLELSARALTQFEEHGYEWDASIEDLSYQANLIANGLAMGLAGGGDIEAVYRAADGLALGIATQGRLATRRGPVG